MAFITWWYGAGWRGTITGTKNYLENLSKSFSVPILVKTLFAPWKQMDAYGQANPSLGDRFRHQIDKLVSRFVGFFVRFFTLLAVGVSFIGVLLLRIIWIAFWPVLPLLIPAALLYSLGVF